MKLVALQQQHQQCQAIKPCRAFSRPSKFVVRANASSSSSQAEPSSAAPLTTRRSFIGAVSLAPALMVAPHAALAAKAPKGFSAYEDLGDNYKFLYPFGWQEVAVDGADVVFKDIVEPLESISVTITTTDKQDVTEFGGIQEVAETLAKEVLTPPGQEVTVLSTEQRDLNNKNYFEFEFTAKGPRYTRHSLAAVVAANGKFYTLTTGANEKRWGKIKDRLKTAIRSFQLII